MTDHVIRRIQALDMKQQWFFAGAGRDPGAATPILSV
jgi:hypothetical protein